VRAEIRVNGTLIGETTTRANGRLLFLGTDVVSAVNPAVFEARLFDASSNQIATLTTNVTITQTSANCEEEPGVTDNDDTDGYFTTIGSWGAGTAQPDRWCPARPGASYDLTSSNSGSLYARWRPRLEGPGIYRVYIWYSASSNRATDARFSVIHKDGTTPISVNQREQGGDWRLLGDFPFSDVATERVELRNNHNTNGEFIIADAVRVVYLAPLPTDTDLWMVK
jgi:hypothetical protein